MKSFDGIAAFIRHLAIMQATIPAAEKDWLTAAARIVQREAKAELGTYQRANTGPFGPWPELADATKRERAEKGFSENEPLLRTGALRDSITVAVRGHEAAIGSESEIAVYQELGTTGSAGSSMWGKVGRQHVPPRPFLGPAGFRKGEEAAKLIGAHVGWHVAGLPPRKP